MRWDCWAGEPREPLLRFEGAEVWGVRGGRREAHAGVSCELWAVRAERQLEACALRVERQHEA